MIQFAPHRKLLLERIADLKEAAAASFWISDSHKSDVRLQSSLMIGNTVERLGLQPSSSNSWAEARCVDRVRKAFPFLSVGDAYDVVREHGGETSNADDAIAVLKRDSSLVRRKAV